MMANQLVISNNKLRVRPLGIGEILRRLIFKCVLEVVRKKATVAYGTANLSTGLPVGI